ncbi:MAG: dual specificity protein phosphatase family protein [Halobacteriovoraceae bacterium]|nr:dual specificity protein phosphatase family protein [Halobacteriovoraceae bacterium]
MLKYLLFLVFISGILGAADFKTKLYQYKNLYFSGQITDDEISLLKSKGISTVINIRQKNEHDEASEKKLVTKQGLEYFNIPFNIKNFSQETIDTITNQVVDSRKKGGVLIHCASGGRVGIWLGAHFYKDHKLSKEEALKKAEENGLSGSYPTKVLKEFLKMD